MRSVLSSLPAERAPPSRRAAPRVARDAARRASARRVIRTSRAALTAARVPTARSRRSSAWGRHASEPGSRLLRRPGSARSALVRARGRPRLVWARRRFERRVSGRHRGGRQWARGCRGTGCDGRRKRRRPSLVRPALVRQRMLLTRRGLHHDVHGGGVRLRGRWMLRLPGGRVVHGRGVPDPDAQLRALELRGLLPGTEPVRRGDAGRGVRAARRTVQPVHPPAADGRVRPADRRRRAVRNLQLPWLLRRKRLRAWARAIAVWE